jgi:hypothetical protein
LKVPILRSEVGADNNFIFFGNKIEIWKTIVILEKRAEKSDITKNKLTFVQVT